MDERAGSASAAQRTGRGHGQQARTHRMGRPLNRRRLSAWSDSDYRIRQSGKDACGLEALRAPTFPLYDYDDFSTKVCTGTVRTKEQSKRRL